MKIRRIEPKDREKLIHLMKIADKRKKEWALRKFQKYLATAEKVLFVAEINKRLVGYVGIKKKEEDINPKIKKILRRKVNYAHVPWIAIHPSYRQKGIGLALLFYCENWAKMKKKKGIWLDCRPKLLHFYERAGYKLEGKFKDKGKDRCILTKPIIKKLEEEFEKISKKLAELEQLAKKPRKFEEAFIELMAMLYVFGKLRGIKKIRKKMKGLAKRWWQGLSYEERLEAMKLLPVKKAYEEWTYAYEKGINALFEIEKKLKLLDLLGNIKSKSILDLGCGTGRYTIPLAKKGAKMTGIDFSRKMLAKAKAKASKEKLIIKFKQGNITKKLPFKNDEFDAVLCALVFNHIKNIKPVFKEVARILKRNGTFVLSDLHPELRERRKYKIIAGEFAAPAYKHRFVDYFRAARSAGLEIYKITEGKVDKELAKLTRVGEGTLLLIVFKLKKEKRLK